MQRGFIALLTVIITAAVLLAFVSSMSLAAFFARSGALNDQQHTSALVLARSCEQLALLQLSQNASYDPTLDPRYGSGGLLQQVGSTSTCYIQAVVPLSSSPSGSVVRVDTWAQEGSAFSTFSASVRLSAHSAPVVLTSVEH